MWVYIKIDSLTDCLVERLTGAIVETNFAKRVDPIKPKEFLGWKFDWCTTQKKGYTIYELFVDGDATVQGRVSLNVDV